MKLKNSYLYLFDLVVVLSFNSSLSKILIDSYEDPNNFSFRLSFGEILREKSKSLFLSLENLPLLLIVYGPSSAEFFVSLFLRFFNGNPYLIEFYFFGV